MRLIYCPIVTYSIFVTTLIIDFIMKACNFCSLFNVYRENAKHAHRILKFDFNFFSYFCCWIFCSRYVSLCYIKIDFLSMHHKNWREEVFLFIKFYCIFCSFDVVFLYSLRLTYPVITFDIFFYPSLALSVVRWIYLCDEIFLALNWKYIMEMKRAKIMKRLIIEIDSLIFIIRNFNGKKYISKN